MAQHEACLVLNAGSSSLKFSVFRRDGGGSDMQAILSGQISGIEDYARFEAKDGDGRILANHRWDGRGSQSRDSILRYLLRWITNRLANHRLVAAGHRVVHGGRAFKHPVRLTPALLDDLETLVPLAPLHQPHNLAAIRAVAAIDPDLFQVACFDTAFHSAQPAVARAFALPHKLADEGVCRYGFHGLSYEYVTRRLLSLRPELADARIVVCHLGNGSSLCAVKGGRSVDSSMGFTALDGVPMGTRPGAVDPGVLLYLMREKHMDADALEEMLYRRSGLLGVSGLSSDMRVLLESDAPAARRAVELFCFRIAKEIGALAASMEGLDALVFTAGIGENSAPVRRMIAERAGWLGVKLDPEANKAGMIDVSAREARIPTFVVRTNEELMIAEHTLQLLAREPQQARQAVERYEYETDLAQ
jgi:acetate kinase